MADNMASAFAPGTPPAVRDLIETMLATPADLSSRLRAAIERLAANEEMESLWKQLPTKLRGKEFDLILQAILAYDRAAGLRPPHEQQMTLMKGFLQEHAPITDPARMAEYNERFVSPLTYGSIAITARLLLGDLKRISSRARVSWQEAWPGDAELTFDKLLSVVEATVTCCEKLDDEARQIEAAMNFPKPPPKRGGRTAAQVYFADIMQDYFRREFDRPMTPTVAVLSQVMFDLPEGVDESTIRKRSRRIGRLPQK
jgi:hypothetical protein